MQLVRVGVSGGGGVVAVGMWRTSLQELMLKGEAMVNLRLRPKIATIDNLVAELEKYFLGVILIFGND